MHQICIWYCHLNLAWTETEKHAYFAYSSRRQNTHTHTHTHMRAWMDIRACSLFGSLLSVAKVQRSKYACMSVCILWISTWCACTSGTESVCVCMLCRTDVFGEPDISTYCNMDEYVSHNGHAQTITCMYTGRHKLPHAYIHTIWHKYMGTYILTRFSPIFLGRSERDKLGNAVYLVLSCFQFSLSRFAGRMSSGEPLW